MSATDIIRAALAAATVDDAERVQQMIARDIGQRFERPAGDRWNNHGHLSSIGNREHKLLELLTNGQDAILERFACSRFGADDAVPYQTPHEAAAALLGKRSWQEIADMVTIELRESDPDPKDEAADAGCQRPRVWDGERLPFAVAAVPRHDP